MASLISRISSLARSSQGRRLGDRARRFASKPENRRKVEGLVSRLTGRSGSKGGRSATRARSRRGR